MLRRLLWLLPVAIIFWNLGYAPFWNPDEGRYIAASYEMVHPFDGAAPDWLVPHLNTVPRLNKPPLIYWGTALSFRALGVHEWSARMVPALASLLILVLLYVWATRVWSARAGLAAGVVWATCIGVVAMGRVTNTDMLLCASIALTMFGIFWAIESETKQLHAGALAGVGMGLAILSKGPVGVALPLLIAFVYLCATRGWKRAPWGAIVLALCVGVAIGAPWFLLVEAREPGFLHTFVVSENLSRFSGKADFHKKTSPFYYIPVVILGLLPWTGFLLPMIARWRESNNLAMRAKIFAALWAVLWLGFFSLSGTKLISYALPAFPALAFLLGGALARWDETGRVWQRAAIGLTLFFNAALLVALWAVPHRDKISKIWELKPGVLLDNVIVPREVGWPWTLIFSAVVVVVMLGFVAMLRGANGRAVIVWSGLSATAIAVTLLGLAGNIASYKDATRMIVNLRPILTPQDRVASYRAFVPTAIPYLERPLTFFRFDNSSGLYERDLEKSRYYSTAKSDDDFKKWLQKPGRAFIITEGFKDAPLAHSLYLWGRTNDFFLLSNRPRTANLDAKFTFASPRSRVKNQLVKTPKK